MNRPGHIIAFLLALSAFYGAAYAAPPPVANIKVSDVPNDSGTQLEVIWESSKPADAQPAVTTYRILRRDESPSAKAAEAKQGDPAADGFEKVGEVAAPATRFVDAKGEPSGLYRYRIVAIDANGAESPAIESDTAVAPKRQWFDTRRGWYALILMLLCGAVIYCIVAAQRGKPMKLRKIAGLEAVEEAVGRATELGRSCLFVPGIQDINDIQTVAGLTVLAHVARTAARYDAQIEVPTARSLVMTTARETVQAAFLGAGRPDAYREDLIYYITDEQFGYVAAVAGKMVREKPAATFLMGSFFAESLILAETGNSIGAIQLAGTAQPSQLPFFVAACDYTLIGEELFAASAYLSGEPQQLGSVKGQDFGKVVWAVLLVVGTLLATAAAFTGPDSSVKHTLDFLKENVLGNKGFTR